MLRGRDPRDVLVRAFGTDGLGEVDATERVDRQLGDEDRDDLEALVLVEAMGLVHDRVGDAVQPCSSGSAHSRGSGRSSCGWTRARRFVPWSVRRRFS